MKINLHKLPTNHSQLKNEMYDNWFIIISWGIFLFFSLSDIGLEQFDTASLFVKLLTPTSFLTLIILQVHYFHNTFLKPVSYTHLTLPTICSV